MRIVNAPAVSPGQGGSSVVPLGFQPDNARVANGSGEIVRLTGGPKVWRGLLSQTGTDAPTAIVLENSLGGDIVWTYSSTGIYLGTLVGAFPANKTFTIGSASHDGSNLSFSVPRRASDNIVGVVSVTSSNVLTDSLLLANELQILVYP